MTEITARVICDSIGEHSPRLTTFLTRYPKFIHAEHMRHRTGSYSASSSRAVPVEKNILEVASEYKVFPVFWGSEMKGMQTGEQLSPEKMAQAKYEWNYAALQAAHAAKNLLAIGAHKSIINRILEPFLHINVLVTSCEPGLMNFFGLRLDRAAQPEMRVLAEEMWRAWNESRAIKLINGQWHLPFIDEADWEILNKGKLIPECSPEFIYSHPILKISIARCARLSYASFKTEKRSTLEEDLALYERLVGSRPMHASPAEHQATPDTLDRYMQWANLHLHGNLPGWIQYRKTLSGESIAPLPEGYSS